MLTVVFAIVSSMLAGTLFEHAADFRLLDAFGLFPFLVYVVAPVAFQTERERRILLIAFVGLGAYLGLTTLFESLHVNALVFPKYILNAAIGDTGGEGRARGPFAAAVQNGFALYGCACVSALAGATWRDWRARICASAVVLVCLLGVLLTLQRSVWIGAITATAIVMICVPRLRAWLVPAVVVGVAGVILALALVPGLSENVSSRASQSVSVWERENMTVAALNMIQAKPLLGFGWGTFTEVSEPYFRQSASYPLVGTTVPCHDTYLGFAAELGLIGVTLWILALLWGVGGAILSRARTMFSWRMALLAVFLFYLVVIAFVPPPTGFPVLIAWLLAGVVTGGRAARPGDPGGTG